MDTRRRGLPSLAAAGAPPDGFLIDGHLQRFERRRIFHGAPPDGFLIDGHLNRYTRAGPRSRGAPPDGFLIDGHLAAAVLLLVSAVAHRLTGFSSMDTQALQQVLKKLKGAPPDGFLIDGHTISIDDNTSIDDGRTA